MKLLVSGCSFSAGEALEGEKQSSDLWCNQLAQYLNADLTNLARKGADNISIFLEAFNELTKNDYDLAIIQVSALTRTNITPTNHGVKTLVSENISGGLLSDQDYNNFYKYWLIINNPIIYWERLIKLLNISKNFKTKIMFVNGLIDWSSKFFDSEDSKFHRYLMSEDSIPDDEIKDMLNYINQTKKQIELDNWLVIESMSSYSIDKGSDNAHPGPKTHQLLVDKIKARYDSIS